jgi:hypothetical protein
MSFQPGSGSLAVDKNWKIKFDVSFGEWEKEQAEERSSGGVFFATKENIDEEGNVSYQHPNYISWTGHINESGVFTNCN